MYDDRDAEPQSCTKVHRVGALFFWPGRGPSAFRQDEKKMGGRIAQVISCEHAISLAKNYKKTNRPRSNPRPVSYSFISSVTTYWQSSIPAAAGTQTREPGTLRRPGGGIVKGKLLFF